MPFGADHVRFSPCILILLPVTPVRVPLPLTHMKIAWYLFGKAGGVCKTVVQILTHPKSITSAVKGKGLPQRAHFQNPNSRTLCFPFVALASLKGEGKGHGRRPHGGARDRSTKLYRVRLDWGQALTITKTLGHDPLPFILELVAGKGPAERFWSHPFAESQLAVLIPRPVFLSEYL